MCFLGNEQSYATLLKEYTQLQFYQYGFLCSPPTLLPQYVRLNAECFTKCIFNIYNSQPRIPTEIKISCILARSSGDPI